MRQLCVEWRAAWVLVIVVVAGWAMPCRPDDAAAQAVPSFAGKFANEKLALDLHAAGDGYAGTIVLGSNTFEATAKVSGEQLSGSFTANGKPFPFSATRGGDVVTLSSGGNTYILKAATPAPANPLAGAPAPTAKANPGAAANGNAAGRDVMRFQKYSVQDDPNWIGGEAMTLLIPAGWKVEGGMVWRPETYSRVQPHLQISDPNSVAQITIYPKQTFTYGVRVRGNSYMGHEIAAPPRGQYEALSQYVIPRFRQDLGQAKVVDKQDLPKLAESPSNILLSLPGLPAHGAAGRVRFAYEVNGQAVEEDFIFRYLERPVDGRSPNVVYWLIDNVYSVRGPKGSLDKLTPVLLTVAQSQRLSLPWYNKLIQFVQMQTQAEINRIKQIGIQANIRAKLSNEVNESRKQSFEAQEKNEDASNQATAETMRDQQPWTTTDGRTVELPFQYGITWQGANGELISTNDAGYNPNSDSNNTTTYTQLQKAPGLSGQ